MSDCDKSAHCSVGIREARRFHAQYGSVMNVWIGKRPHFWTDDWHLGLDPVEYILCTHFTLYFVYRIRRVSQKKNLINITTLFSIIFHKFHQIPSIFQPFPYIPWFFLSRFSVSPPPRWPLCTHKGHRWIKKHAMSWGPGHGTDFLLRMRFHSSFSLLHILKKVQK